MAKPGTGTVGKAEQPFTTKNTEDTEGQREETSTAVRIDGDARVDAGVQEWFHAWEAAKQSGDARVLDRFYDQVKVALNGPAQKRGVEDILETLKLEIERYAAGRAGKTEGITGRMPVLRKRRLGQSLLRSRLARRVSRR